MKTLEYKRLTKYLNPLHDKKSDGTKFFVDWNYHNQVFIPYVFMKFAFAQSFKRFILKIPACVIMLDFQKSGYIYPRFKDFKILWQLAQDFCESLVLAFHHVMCWILYQL